MKAVLFPGDKKVDVVDRPDPVPGFGEVLIRMRASALCRSDMSIYYGRPVVGGEATKTGLIVPGHEPAGEVAGVGPGATGVKLGDRVAVYLAIGCGRCQWCHSGFRMLCPEWKCLGFDVDGGDADYLVAPAVNCLKLPDDTLLRSRCGDDRHDRNTVLRAKEIGGVWSDNSGRLWHRSDGGSWCSHWESARSSHHSG